MGIAAVFALSYNLLLGQTGLLSFGHAVYFGLGGYAAIHLMRAINARPRRADAAGAAGRRRWQDSLFGLVFGAVTTTALGSRCSR